MQYRTLGKSNLQVSSLCLGTMMFGDQTDRNEGAAIVADARDQGVNYIDTADVYGKGASEIMVGELLKGHRHRLGVGQHHCQFGDCRSAHTGAVAGLSAGAQLHGERRRRGAGRQSGASGPPVYARLHRSCLSVDGPKCLMPRSPHALGAVLTSRRRLTSIQKCINIRLTSRHAAIRMGFR